MSWVRDFFPVNGILDIHGTYKIINLKISLPWMYRVSSPTHGCLLGLDQAVRPTEDIPHHGKAHNNVGGRAERN